MADFYLQMEGRVTEINLKLPETGDIETLARETELKLAGIGITLPLSVIGLDFSKAWEGVCFEISPIMFPILNIRSTIFVFFYSVLIASLASLIPSRKAAKIEIGGKPELYLSH